MSTKIFAKGELFVTRSGEVIVDEILPKSRALLVQPDSYISVEFDPNQPPPPPCAGGLIDELDWELFVRRVEGSHHFGRPEEELRLKICWQVQTARTILWSIRVPS
jgi:hypothetical protein